MIVCQILGGNEEGGLEKHVEELSNALSETMTVHVIACEKYRDRFAAAVTFHAVDLTRGRRNPLMLAQMASLLRSIQPDVIHAHASKATQILAAIKRWVPGKKIATLHGYRKKLDAYNNMDGVITINTGLAEHLNGPAVKVIPNGLRMPAGPMHARTEILAEAGLTEGKPLAVAIGRLVKAKAYTDLISAWRKVDGNLIIIGDGEERGQLAALIEEYNLQERVKLLGHRDSAYRYLPGCDFLVISSLSEGGPYTLVEALLLSVPVVATRVGMCPDWVPEGYLCEVGEIHALSTVLQHACHGRESMRSEFHTVYERAREVLSLEGMVQSTLGYYSECGAQNE